MVLIDETGMAGTFIAQDLILFFVFFEVVLLPMYFMIGVWGDKSMRKIPGFSREIETRLYASIKFVMNLDCVDAVTMGFKAPSEIDEAITRMNKHLNV